MTLMSNNSAIGIQLTERWSEKGGRETERNSERETERENKRKIPITQHSSRKQPITHQMNCWSVEVYNASVCVCELTASYITTTLSHPAVSCLMLADEFGWQGRALNHVAAWERGRAAVWDGELPFTMELKWENSAACQALFLSAGKQVT